MNLEKMTDDQVLDQIKESLTYRNASPTQKIILKYCGIEALKVGKTWGDEYLEALVEELKGVVKGKKKFTFTATFELEVQISVETEDLSEAIRLINRNQSSDQSDYLEFIEGPLLRMLSLREKK